MFTRLHNPVVHAIFIVDQGVEAMSRIVANCKHLTEDRGVEGVELCKDLETLGADDVGLVKDGGNASLIAKRWERDWEREKAFLGNPLPVGRAETGCKNQPLESPCSEKVLQVRRFDTVTADCKDRKVLTHDRSIKLAGYNRKGPVARVDPRVDELTSLDAVASKGHGDLASPDDSLSCTARIEFDRHERLSFGMGDAFRDSREGENVSQRTHESMAFSSARPFAISSSRTSMSAMISSGGRCSASSWTISL